ncbi:hypothetical protein QF049_004754 [Paenibacillus sp. W4I10]|uniref:hypothetical protein n=1 Tax=Paenibacillus sp. W4I10 TaxID=3042298 RepID=UPI00278796DA|nr:hypothetical protein [Paenibacillus sp. W4I10]MDQ0723493.1 hypothetical protein [Paenibacillus sp. W4I10]
MALGSVPSAFAGVFIGLRLWERIDIQCFDKEPLQQFAIFSTVTYGTVHRDVSKHKVQFDHKNTYQ